MEDKREKLPRSREIPPPQKRDRSPQLWTDNVFTYDVESPDHTEKRKNISFTFMPQIISSRKKGCHWRTRGINDQLYIDQLVLKEAKTRQKNVAMEWIDLKNVYDMVLQTWILEYLKIYKISDSHKLHPEYHRKMEVGIDSRRTNPCWDKNPKQYLPKRLDLAIPIFYCKDSKGDQLGIVQEIEFWPYYQMVYAQSRTRLRKRDAFGILRYKRITQSRPEYQNWY